MNANERVILGMIADRLESDREVNKLLGLLSDNTQNVLRRVLPAVITNYFDNDADKVQAIATLREMAG